MMTNKQSHVLVVDDETLSLKLMRRIMEREGFAVTEARDGEAALETAGDHNFDLILMDVTMPRLDGFEVLQRLRDDPKTARVPVIFITARQTEPTSVERGLGLGADDYMRKPFDPGELAARAHNKIKAHQLEESLKQRTAELEALVSIGEELNKSLELDELLELVLNACSRQLPADNGALVLYDMDDSFKRWCWLNPLSEETDAQVEADLKIIEQLKDTADDGLDNRLPAHNPFVRTYGYRSVIWTTLYHHGRKLGILGLMHCTPDTYNDDNLRLLRSIARQAALAIRNAELYEELRDYADNLEAKVEERQAELEAAQEVLVRSEKLTSLGRLSASIAHEINNPLQPVLNCLNMAVEDLNEGLPVDQELLQVAEQSVRRIKRITRELLTFAKESHDEYAPVNLNDILNETFILTRKQMQHTKIKLVTDMHPLPQVEAIADRLRQVFINLTLNAIEAMPDGGELRVVTQTVGDNFVLISFEDTGCGIALEHLSRIFEPFFSTKGENGTGLGLSVSYGIIDGHGGTIQVESMEGEGSTFYIWIPVRQGTDAEDMEEAFAQAEAKALFT